MSAPRAGVSSWLIARAKVAFTPVALAALAYFAWSSREPLGALVEHARADRLIAAVFAWAAIQGFVALFTSVALGACGAEVDWRAAFRSHAARLPARYLPGGIWHTVGRLADLQALGVGARSLAAFVALENAVALGITATAGGLAVLFVGRPEPWSTLAAVGAITGLAGLCALPWLVSRLALGRDVRLNGVGYARAVSVSILFWAGASGSFVLYLSAFPGALVDGAALEAAGVYLFAWAAGFVAIFAPQGIGVFEVAAGDLLRAPLALAGTAALVAGFRGVVLAADLLVFATLRTLRVR